MVDFYGPASCRLRASRPQLAEVLRASDPLTFAPDPAVILKVADQRAAYLAGFTLLWVRLLLFQGRG